MLEQVVGHYNRPRRTNRSNRTQSRQAASGTWINDVEATIYAQLSGLRTTQDVGQLVGMSPKHLSQKFRQAFGLTVAEYLRRERLNAAAYLVAHTDWPLLTSLNTSAIAAPHCCIAPGHKSIPFRRCNGVINNGWRDGSKRRNQALSTRARQGQRISQIRVEWSYISPRLVV